jgi:mRNA-degrading endonuclease RelE of RelBE toxin-antitoxin system
MEFIEAPAFSKYVHDYLRDEDYAALQQCLLRNPDAGDVISGTGGLRKLRWRDHARGKGKRGGLRIIYYFFLADQQILLLTIYDKNEAADLTSEEKKLLRRAIQDEEAARRKISGRLRKGGDAR